MATDCQECTPFADALTKAAVDVAHVVSGVEFNRNSGKTSFYSIDAADYKDIKDALAKWTEAGQALMKHIAAPHDRSTNDKAKVSP